MDSSVAITELLMDWGNGNRAALDELFPLVQTELHKMAHHYMQKMHPGATIQTTVIINETYLRLVDQNRTQWQNRAHFFAIAAMLMRQFLCNYFRDIKTKKRGGEFIQVELEDKMCVDEIKLEQVAALEEALQMLAKLDERKEKVVEMKYFGGMSVSEIAQALNISEITVARDWNLAKAWLAREIRKNV